VATVKRQNDRILEQIGFGNKKSLLASPTEVGEEPITRPPTSVGGQQGVRP